MIKKKKGPRILITLECNQCHLNINKNKNGISRYFTNKNKRTINYKLELYKYCKYCNKHILHKEIKK